MFSLFICEESFTPRSRSLRPLTATVCAKLLTRQTRPPTEAASMEARGNVPPQTIPEGGRFEGRPRPAFDPRFDRRAHLIRGLGGYREIQYSSSTCDSCHSACNFDPLSRGDRRPKLTPQGWPVALLALIRSEW